MATGKELAPMKAPGKSLLDRDLDHLTYPRLVSPKVDGLRCVGLHDGVRSNTLSPFPNAFLNRQLSGAYLHGMDGELTVGPPFGRDVLKLTKSGIMTRASEPDFTWHLFDDFREKAPFKQRWASVKRRLSQLPPLLRGRTEVLPHRFVRCAMELREVEQQYVEAGYEGAMVRDPDGPYKHGRATATEGWLFKLKRFEDAEAVVVSLEEASSNTNEAARRGDGGIKRSTKKSGMVPNGLLGTIVGLDVCTGRPVRMTTGTMTKGEREKYMRSPELLVGQVVTYKFMLYGTDLAPRHASFKSVRHPIE